MAFTKEIIKQHSQAVYNFMIDNNHGHGMLYNETITINNRTVKVFNGEKLISSFNSDISIEFKIGPEYYIIVIENQAEIKPIANKIFFWPNKYLIKYNSGILFIEDEIIKIVIA